MVIWEELHKDMLADIARCRKMELPEGEQVEWAWRMACRYWQQLKGLFKDHVFRDRKEEVDFYKIIKPSFTGYIEFFTVLHDALELAGERGNEYRFWEQESRRWQEFNERHRAFIEYYISGCTCYDREYFTGDSCDPEERIPEPYDADGALVSSHDCLVASLLAEEMYHSYVKEKLAYQ